MSGGAVTRLWNGRPLVSRTVAYVVLQVTGMLLALACFSRPLPEPPAQFKLTEAMRLDPFAIARPVTLPDLARPASLEEIEIRYAAQFRYPDEKQPVWSILLPRFLIDARVLVNDVEIGDSGSSPMAGKGQLNLPFIALIPDTVLRAGINDVTIALTATPPIAKHLESIFAGPDAVLRPAFNQRVFLFQTLPQVFSAWQLLLALLLFMIWTNRRQDLPYGILALAMFIGFIRTSVLNYSSLQATALIGTMIVIESALIVPFTLSLMGYRMRWWWSLMFLPGLFILWAGVIDDPLLVKFTFLFFGPPSVVVHVLFISAILAHGAIGRGIGTAFLFGTAMSLVLASLIHDALTIFGLLSGTRYFFASLSYSTVLVAVGTLLTLRFVQALNRIDSFAAQMVVKIGEAEDKLRQSFAREEMRARAEALAEERERLMRDLHDGLGGQLVRIVALSERNGGEPERISEAARGALKDLRLVIDAMEDVGGDLLLALASWRERTEMQLRVHQVALNWQVFAGEASLTFAELRPWHVIQIIRVMDEAVTNAVRHSGAGSISVLLRAGASGDEAGPIHITIRDDGHGFEGVPAKSGGGLSNMRKRASLCNARLTVESGEFGTSIDIELPRELPAAPVTAGVAGTS